MTPDSRSNVSARRCIFKLSLKNRLPTRKVSIGILSPILAFACATHRFGPNRSAGCSLPNTDPGCPMIHFGMLCPALFGHLNPMMALGRELQRLGHRVTFYQRLICRSKLESAGFRVRPFAEQEFPVEVTRAQLAELAELGGLKALNFTVEILRRRTAACLREVPQLAREDGIDALLVDEVSWEGATIAEELGIPFITVCNAPGISPEEPIPPFPTTWRYSTSLAARFRNNLGYRVLTRVARPLLKAVNDRRQQLGMS